MNSTVPALVYPANSAILSAALPSGCATPEFAPLKYGEGVSSISFWFRRWMEQSRSPGG